MKTRILIVDDHPLFRDGLRALLQKEADFDVVGEADSVTSAVHRAQALQPHVVLMDLSLPDGSGAEAARQILMQQPQVYVIVLTVHDEPEGLIELAQAGVHGYILKGTRSTELIRAVREVLTSGTVLSPELLPAWLEQYRRLARAADPILSPRERAILQLVAQGVSNREIANRLALSLQTIKNHLSVVYAKLSVGNRTEAVVVAMERGLLDQEPNRNSFSPAS